MFKRITSVAIAIAMVLAFCTAYAQQELTAENYTPKEEEKTQAIQSVLDGQTIDMERSGANGSTQTGGFNFPTTTDIVTIGEDGKINLTVDGITITAYTPFGMLAFTQDILAQVDTYMALSDPGGLVEAMQSIGAHMILKDLASNSSYYMYITNDMVSTLVDDIDELPPEGLQGLAAAIDSFEPMANVYGTELGGNAFLVYDYRKAGLQEMIYSSVKNSTCIDFYIVPAGEEITAQEIEIMETFLKEIQIAKV